MPLTWTDLGLAWPLAKRDILARYRGSLIGMAWALVAPLAMVLVYTLVFRGVFQARWGAGAGSVDGFGYVTRLFAGADGVPGRGRSRDAGDAADPGTTPIW